MGYRELKRIQCIPRNKVQSVTLTTIQQTFNFPLALYIPNVPRYSDVMLVVRMHVGHISGSSAGVQTLFSNINDIQLERQDAPGNYVTANMFLGNASDRYGMYIDGAEPASHGKSLEIGGYVVGASYPTWFPPGSSIDMRWYLAACTTGTITLKDIWFEADLWYYSDDVSPENADVVDILADTNEIQGKLPTDYIMGSQNQTPYSDEITQIYNQVDNLLKATFGLGFTVQAGSTTLVVKTNLGGSYPDDYFNDMQIVIPADVWNTTWGLARRIADFDGTSGDITLDSALPAAPTTGDSLYILSRYTAAGSALTPSAISAAVWSEPLPGGFTSGMAGYIVDYLRATADAIEADTQDIQSRIPTTLISGRMRSHVEAKDSSLPLSAQEKLDVNTEVDTALSDYDSPTKAELDAAEANIISEIDVNEGKIDNLQTDMDEVLLDTADMQPKVDAMNTRLPPDPADQSLVEAAILVSEAAIRGSDSDDLKTLSDQLDALSAQVGTIQNNVNFSTTVLPSYERPTSGSSIIKIIAQVFDATGNPEDPDSDELYIKLDGSVTGNLIPQTLMTKSAVGVYYYNYTIQSTDNLENWEFEFYYVEGGVDKYHYRNSRLQDYSDDLNDIREKVNANYVKLDAATPSPTVPAQITQHDVDNKALQRVKACPDLMYVPFGRSQIDVEGGITAIDTEIPVKISDNFLESGIVKIESEYIIYDGITDSKLQVTSRGAYGTTPTIHANNVVVSQSVLFPLRLTIKDNEGNMKAPDSPPTVEVDDWNGTQELAPTAMTLISTGLYGYNYIIDQGELPENKVFMFTTVVDSITAKTPHEVVIIDQIASSNEVAASLGGLGEFVLDQDGWYDNDGIKHLWTDAMAGFVKDVDTGAPLDDAYVTAYVYENGETKYNGRPPGQARTRSNGTWLMYLDAGEYTFVVEKDGFRIVGGGIVNRTVGS